MLLRDKVPDVGHYKSSTRLHLEEWQQACHEAQGALRQGLRDVGLRHEAAQVQHSHQVHRAQGNGPQLLPLRGLGERPLALESMLLRWPRCVPLQEQGAKSERTSTLHNRKRPSGA